MIKKIIAILSVTALFFSAVSLPSYGISSKEDIEKEIEDLEKEINGYEDQLNAIKNDKSKQAQYIDELQKQVKAYDEQVELLNQQIYPLNEQIEELDKKIGEYEKKIASLEKEISAIDVKISDQNVKIDETYEVLKKRLRAAYMAGETSELELFLNATDFQDFLIRSELLRQVSKRDKKIISDLEEQISSLQKMVDDLAAKRAENEASKKALSDDRAEIDAARQQLQAKKAVADKKLARSQSKVQQINEIIGRLDQKSSQVQSLMAKAEREKADYANELDKWISNNGSSGSGENVDNGNVTHKFRISAKGYISPLQDKTTYYSANFASHSSRGTASVDLCAPLNRVINGKTYNTTKTANIYAVASGKVIQSTYKGSSYGNYVTIDHGNGITSLYAHCDSRLVSVGDRVVQGQVIAKAGNTGNVYPRPSTANPVAGSHLHFEMRLNGSRVNPEKYLPSPLV